MYKDKDRQREANRLAQAKFKAKGITKGITSEGMTYENGGITLPDKLGPVIPKQGSTSPSVECGVMTNSTPAKRGKAIKCFADLPPDVQETINRMSGQDKTEHKRRTAIAIHYQHLFPAGIIHSRNSIDGQA